MQKPIYVGKNMCEWAAATIATCDWRLLVLPQPKTTLEDSLMSQTISRFDFKCFDNKDVNAKKSYSLQYIIYKKGFCWKVLIDPGRTWTCNLRCRKPTPYPLGHRAPVTMHQILVLSDPPRFQHSSSCPLGHLWTFLNPLISLPHPLDYTLEVYICVPADFQFSPILCTYYKNGKTNDFSMSKKVAAKLH